ncbi:MAG: high-potential iron-sulfur protein [Myxococcota bacterium]|nr:high-potential iron-sulfur protein [Myxococcota bacterium]MDP7432820.1 high-potential iron-sulfur protein [Myxococcota bacterium]
MTESRVDRRGFVGIGLRAVAAVFALPAAASLLASCGNGEQPAAPQAPSPPKAAAPAAPPVPAASPPGGGTEQLITEIAGSAAMVQALQYVNQSAKPDQNCGNCQLYTAQSGGVGKCQLFATGLVKEAGWCASWAAKVTAENS